MIQSILFKKSYGLNKCIKWLIKHNYKYNKIDETNNFYRFRQKQPNKKYNYITKKINKNIEFIIYYDKNNKIGSSIFSNIKEFGKKLIHGRSDYPPSVKKILEQYKNNDIIKIELHRLVLPSLYTNILNVWSKGEINKRLQNEDKDKLFHISAWLYLNNNMVILCEKNEVINLKINPKKAKEEEIKLITLSHNINFFDFFENTRKNIGDDKFFGYSAKNNNCGNFIEYLLKNNNINDSNGFEFIRQDTNKILDGFPLLRKTLNTVTGIAAHANVLIEGGDLLNNINNGLSNKQIINILKRNNFKINGIYSKDKLPKKIKNGYYIINLQNQEDGDGTHWTSFYYFNSDIYYFDSFGMPPPESILKLCKNSIYYNKKIIQNFKKSSACGFYCIGFIICDNFLKYINMFSNNTIKNDKILNNFFNDNNIK